MIKTVNQLDLFHSQSLNPTYEIKRQIRLALNESSLSRDQVVDEMNNAATSEGIMGTISKTVLDGWCKNSDPGRLPSLPWLTVFCRVMETAAPIEAMLRPLGCGVLNGDDVALLAWGKAELEKRKATKRARLALEMIE